MTEKHWVERAWPHMTGQQRMAVAVGFMVLLEKLKRDRREAYAREYVVDWT